MVAVGSFNSRMASRVCLVSCSNASDAWFPFEAALCLLFFEPFAFRSGNPKPSPWTTDLRLDDGPHG
ncbi:hypothetical protein QJS10_CPB20g00405 [Acorus calamus]|uniref:Uncharacterized protein n=1 Tax=Acorus calamus TaxID=4465 RepID=A0AAV9CAM2_ACOCL|nr:hypothetical protein QJS10_CPB20g00405 [Acorus calamus]